MFASNPPYVRSGDIDTLPTDVRHEPRTALDGGEDGLLFYRAIAENYAPLLEANGALMAEVGIDEAAAVAEIFASAGLTDIRIVNDYSDIPRVVSAVKKC